MSDHELYSPIPDNFELQEVYLRQLQYAISQCLFESGVAARLFSADIDIRGTRFPRDGIDQLDLIFTPVISKTRTSDGREEQVLSLAAIKPGQTQTGIATRQFAYKGVGMIDPSGTLMRYPDVEERDGEQVHEAARELIAARESGELPDLRFSLLDINNPRTSIAINRSR